MIPVSTSVLMVLLKPLQVLSAVQRVFSFGPRKGNIDESVKPTLKYGIMYMLVRMI